jgi:hypothetical protein
MLDQTKALDILNREKDYEDRLVENLDNYFLVSLDSIDDITDEQKEKIRHHLKIIIKESMKHRYLFDQLIQRVMEHGEDNY